MRDFGRKRSGLFQIFIDYFGLHLHVKGDHGLDDLDRLSARRLADADREVFSEYGVLSFGHRF